MNILIEHWHFDPVDTDFRIERVAFLQGIFATGQEGTYRKRDFIWVIKRWDLVDKPILKPEMPPLEYVETSVEENVPVESLSF